MNVHVIFQRSHESTTLTFLVCYNEDTFVLQEFFVPASALHRWLLQAKAGLTKKYKFLTLLNLTIRFVKQDNITFLSYSRAEEGSFAFVLYYRIRKNKEADEELQKIHNVLARISLDLGGTFTFLIAIITLKSN